MKSNKILLAIMFIVLVGLVSAEPVPRYGAVVIRDEVTYGLLDPDTNMVNQVPDPVEPGGYVEVRFKVENIGAETVENLVFELLPQYPFSLDRGSKAVKMVGDIVYQAGDEAYILYYKLRVDKDAIEGNNPIKAGQWEILYHCKENQKEARRRLRWNHQGSGFGRSN